MYTHVWPSSETLTNYVALLCVEVGQSCSEMWSAPIFLIFFNGSNIITVYDLSIRIMKNVGVAETSVYI